MWTADGLSVFWHPQKKKTLANKKVFKLIVQEKVILMRGKTQQSVNYASFKSIRSLMNNIAIRTRNFLKFVTLILQYIPKDPRLKCHRYNYATTINYGVSNNEFNWYQQWWAFRSFESNKIKIKENSINNFLIEHRQWK